MAALFLASGEVRCALSDSPQTGQVPKSFRQRANKKTNYKTGKKHTAGLAKEKFKSHAVFLEKNPNS